MALVPILWTTRSRCSSHVLCMDGVQGMSHLLATLSTNIHARCQVLWGNLEEDALDCSQALFEKSTLDRMWDEYGIIGDLVVGFCTVLHMSPDCLLAIYE